MITTRSRHRYNTESMVQAISRGDRGWAATCRMLRDSPDPGEYHSRGNRGGAVVSDDRRLATAERSEENRQS